MSLLTYSVPGISCAHCKHNIESEVSKVLGVSRVTVDVGSKTVSVEGDGTDALIRAAIVEAGYDVAGSDA